MYLIICGQCPKCNCQEGNMALDIVCFRLIIFANKYVLPAAARLLTKIIRFLLNW